MDVRLPTYSKGFRKDKLPAQFHSSLGAQQGAADLQGKSQRHQVFTQATVPVR